ncbi:MAG: hypothetical protein JWN91_506 [Nocardioides sp.]|jgi:hypothetical protein|nr:hypothetical protein [Nocardioides sp.]
MAPTDVGGRVSNDPMAQTETMTGRTGPRVVSIVFAVLAVAAAWLGTAWALDAADGVSRIRGVADSSSYNVEFIEPATYLGAAVLATLLAAAAAYSWWIPAAAAQVGTVAALAWGASVDVQRYRDSDWSDGLEVFIYVVPIGTAAAGAVCLFLAWVWGRR